MNTINQQLQLPRLWIRLLFKLPWENSKFSTLNTNRSVVFVLVFLCDRPCTRMVFRGCLTLSSSLRGLKVRSRDMSLGTEDWGVASRRWMEASLGSQVPLWNRSCLPLCDLMKQSHTEITLKPLEIFSSHYSHLDLTQGNTGSKERTIPQMERHIWAALHLSEQWVCGLQQVVMETSVQLQQPEGEVGRSRRGEWNTSSRKWVRGIGAQLPANHLGPWEEAEISVW